MTERRGKSRSGVAMEVIRNQSNVFPGLGVYSITEVFHKAGMCHHAIWDAVYTIHVLQACPQALLNVSCLNLQTAQHASVQLSIHLQQRRTQTYGTGNSWYDTHMFTRTGWYHTRQFVSPFLRGYLIAADEAKRLTYADNLHVWGKQRVYSSSRSFAAMVKFKVCSLYSIFHIILTSMCLGPPPEPGQWSKIVWKILDSVNHQRSIWWLWAYACAYCIWAWTFAWPPHLSRCLEYIGQYCWLSVRSVARIWPTFSIFSPRYCISYLLLNTALMSNIRWTVGLGRCFIDINVYSTLFVENGSRAWQNTYVYRLNGKTDVWSALPIFSDYSKSGYARYLWFGAFNWSHWLSFSLDNDTGRWTVYTEQQRKDKTIKETIQTKNIKTVGPLDYCGIARIVKSNGGGEPRCALHFFVLFFSYSLEFKRILVCNNDPRFEYHAVRLAYQDATRSLNKHPGRRKQGVSSLSNAKKLHLPPLPIHSMQRKRVLQQSAETEAKVTFTLQVKELMEHC